MHDAQPAWVAGAQNGGQQLQVRRGRLVFDPFVGTGGVLLAAAHHGAATLGSDIDMRVIRLGKTDKAGRQVPPCCRFSCFHTNHWNAEAHT